MDILQEKWTFFYKADFLKLAQAELTAVVVNDCDRYKDYLERDYLRYVKEYIHKDDGRECSGKFILTGGNLQTFRLAYSILTTWFRAKQPLGELVWGNILPIRILEQYLDDSDKRKKNNCEIDWDILKLLYNCYVSHLDAFAMVLKQLDEEKLLTIIESLEQPCIFLWVENPEEVADMLDNLLFSYDFEMINLDRISFEEGCRIFQQGIKQCEINLTPSKCTDIFSELWTYRGSAFCEDDIVHYIRIAFLHASRNNHELPEESDFYLDYMKPEKNELEKLKQMVGLSQVKETVRKKAALRHLMVEKGIGKSYGHMIFAGDPGTAKSMVARMYAGILAQMGISNGVFIEADRSCIIGEYLGHTASKISGLFKQADGGVIFIDEAGFLTELENAQKESANFVREAVTELVRYMENQPQTIVIFATYPDMAKKLLQCDPGFESRIQDVLWFEPYSPKELYQILQKLAKDQRYRLGNGVKDIVRSYIEQRMKNENFGNGREMRKLLEFAIEEFADENVGEHSVFEKEEYLLLKKHHFALAAQRIQKNELSGENECVGRRIGFSVTGVTGDGSW